MHVFIDDSGDGGFKFESGSSSHLVMAACIFTYPSEIQLMDQLIDGCRRDTRHYREFKYNGTRDKIQDAFFAAVNDVDFTVRAIIIDKSVIHSAFLRESPSALKSYAIRQLLQNNGGHIKAAKIVVDGQDTKAFGIEDTRYLATKVNDHTPGTIDSVRFFDSRTNIGLQLADMVAGAIFRSVRTRKPSDRHIGWVRRRAALTGGNLWHYR